LPEVTKDIEARSARLFAAGGVAPLGHHEKKKAEIGESSRGVFEAGGRVGTVDVLAKAKSKFVVDVLHGCGAGYLDKVLTDHGVGVEALRTNRDVLFDGTGPDVSEENLAPLRKAVVDSKSSGGPGYGWRRGSVWDCGSRRDLGWRRIMCWRWCMTTWWNRADGICRGSKRGDFGACGCGGEGSRAEDVSDTGGI